MSEQAQNEAGNEGGSVTVGLPRPGMRRRHHFNPETRATFVYIIERADGKVKIGISKNPKRRRCTLQSSTPDRLRLHKSYRTAGAAQKETGVHDLLEPWRVSGEWFSCGHRAAEIAVEAVLEGCPAKRSAVQDWARCDVGDADMDIMKAHLPLALRINDWLDV